MEKIYYPDHAQRYAHMSEDERKRYPDEIYFMGWIKRTRTLEELRKEPKGRRYDPDTILLAAKDVPVDQAMLYH